LELREHKSPTNQPLDFELLFLSAQHYLLLNQCSGVND
jgi:hypothetical protein